VKHDHLDLTGESNNQRNKMAVMKTYCGCMSTKSGSQAIFGIYILIYIGEIIFASMKLNGDSFGWFKSQLDLPEECNADKKDTWWCQALINSETVEKEIAISKVVFNSIFLIITIIAIYGTTSDRRFLLLPYIVIEFLNLLSYLAIIIAVLLVLGVYSPGGINMTTTLAIAVLAAIFMVILFYMWLCVVSHFQGLKEIQDITQDKVKVMQFANDFSNDDDALTKYDRFNESYDPHSDDYPTGLSDVDEPPKYEPPSDAAKLEDIDAKVE